MLEQLSNIPLDMLKVINLSEGIFSYENNKNEKINPMRYFEKLENRLKIKKKI